MEFIVTDSIDKTDEAILYQGLLEYNLSKLENTDVKELGVYNKGSNGEICAGVTGITHGNWLMIKYLWVRTEMRGQKLGSLLLNKAESVAVSRGCKFVFLDTFSFQAPTFYEKHGYKNVFTLREYPLEGERHYYTKTL